MIRINLDKIKKSSESIIVASIFFLLFSYIYYIQNYTVETVKIKLIDKKVVKRTSKGSKVKEYFLFSDKEKFIEGPVILSNETVVGPKFESLVVGECYLLKVHQSLGFSDLHNFREIVGLKKSTCK